MYKLIIPDIHQNISRVQILLESKVAQEAEEIIFLGDYFDSFDYDRNTVITCNFLNENINNHNYKFLIGNHDVHYITNVSNYICSGFTKHKKDVIASVLDKGVINKLEPFIYEKIAGKHFLFSHAGLHPSFTPVHFDDMLKGNYISPFFDSLKYGIQDSIRYSTYNVHLAAGMDRGGREKHGGIVWMDWYSLSIIEDLNQIVGHSTFSKPQWFNSENTINLNLDTNLKYYATIDMHSAEVTTHKWPEEFNGM